MENPSKKVKKIGILTGGGDCPGLNAVIRAVVLSCYKHGVSCIGFVDGFEECQKVCDLLSIGGTVLGTTNCGHFASTPLEKEVTEISKKHFDANGLDCLVCVGGDGTMSIAYYLSQHGIPIVGVPKTIDNDLMFTDQTFGFDSAVSIVTESLDRLHTTAASHHRIIIVEVMGRNSGWIALHSGVAGRANGIILPEIDWNWNSLANQIKKSSCSSNYSIIVVAEGAKIPDEGQILISSGKKRLGGIGSIIAKQLTLMIPSMETRMVVLGHVQRGGSPTSFDRILATKFGDMAGNLAASGDFGKMAALKGQRIEAITITGEVGLQRKVELDDQLLLTARNTGVFFGDEEI